MGMPRTGAGSMTSSSANQGFSRATRGIRRWSKSRTPQAVLQNRKLVFFESGLSYGNSFRTVPMNSQDQFAAFEFMCRERAALAQKEMEYWLEEAEEWKRLRKSADPIIEGRVTPATGYSRPNFQS